MKINKINNFLIIVIKLLKMLINNTLVQLPEEYIDYEKGATGAFSESEFINNLMLNPSKYREFKRNINRINNIENEINYIKSLEQKNQIDFVNNIKITEEEYNNALEYSQALFDNLTEIQITDLLSHKKLLSNEKHLVEAMVYFLGIDNLDWNTFKLTFNLYEAKQKMKNIDYSKIRKKKINILLSQLCRGDSIDNFLSNNNLADSGMEFVYEWVKCQMKIYFYLYQNKKIKKKSQTNSTKTTNANSKIFFSPQTKNRIKINEIKTLNIKDKKYELLSNPEIQSLEKMVISEKIDTNFNRDSFSVNNISKSGNFFKTIIPKNNTVGNSPFRIPNIENKKTFLMTSLPFSSRIKNDDYIQSENPLYNIRRKNNEISTRKIFVPVEAQKVNIKLKGYNFQKDKIFREIRTAEMLPLLKNGNYHQMREFFDIKIPINKEIEKRHREDISIYSLTGKKSEKKIMRLIANGKKELMNYISIFKLKQILGNYN